MFDVAPALPHIHPRMALFQHEIFTIDLNKVIAVFQNEDDSAVTIQTDDQRKIEVTTGSPEEAAELLAEISTQWEASVGPLLRHAKHVFRASAIYSIQVEGADLSVYFTDHSVSFSLPDQLAALNLLAELTARWKVALGEAPK